MKKSSLYFLIIWIFFASVNASGQFLIPESPKLPKLDFDYAPAHPMIQQYINYYQGRGRGSKENHLTRSGELSEMMRRIFRAENVPESLVVAYQISDWDGLGRTWFFDKRTARRYGLRQNSFLDETRSFESATQAAALYFNFLSKKYKGNWLLALAAYSAGETAVDRAIERAKVKNFWVIYPYLPKETRNFVPNVLASALIAQDPKLYGFENIQPAPPLRYQRVRIPPSISLNLIAQFSESNPENIKRLNPELISTVTPTQPYIVRLPAEKADIFIERLRRYLQDEKLRRKNKSSKTEDIVRKID